MNERKTYVHNWSHELLFTQGVAISKRKVTVYGRRYNADGWSETKPLFFFRPIVATSNDVSVMTLEDQAIIMADVFENRPLKHGDLRVEYIR